MRNFDANNTEKRLTIKKENRMILINKATHATIRISSKAILLAFVLSVVNLFV